MGKRKQSFTPSMLYSISGSQLLTLEAIGFELMQGTLSQTQCAFTAGRIASILEGVAVRPLGGEPIE
jgi:hypothetical protein